MDSLILISSLVSVGLAGYFVVARIFSGMKEY